MSDRAKEIVIKTTIVVGCVFGVLILIIPIVAAIFDGNYFEVANMNQTPLPQPFYTIWVIDLIAFFISGTILMILLPIFGLKQKPVKAERMHSLFENFEELSGYFESAASNLGYQQHDIICINDQFKMLVFTRKKFWALDCLVLVRVPELTEDILNTANEKFKEFLSGYYGTERITDWVSLISLICVDRITPPFQKFVNSNIQQGFKSYKLPVGVSFGGNTIYISKQKDGLAISKYKKLRKEFLKLLKN